MKQGVLKLFNVGIIYPIKHSTWLENLVLVRKKNGFIKLCVDFRNLHKASLKENYRLQLMEQILHIIASVECFSLIDWWILIIQSSMGKINMNTITRLLHFK